MRNLKVNSAVFSAKEVREIARSHALDGMFYPPGRWGNGEEPVQNPITGETVLNHDVRGFDLMYRAVHKSVRRGLESN